MSADLLVAFKGGGTLQKTDTLEHCVGTEAHPHVLHRSLQGFFFFLFLEVREEIKLKNTVIDGYLSSTGDLHPNIDINVWM